MVFDRNVILFLFPIVIILGKVLRYTTIDYTKKSFMGDSFLPVILNGSVKFSLWDDLGGSANNTIFFFQKLNFLKLHTTKEFEIAITVCAALALFVLLLLRSPKRWTLTQTLFTLSLVGLLSMYCFALQKEPVQMIYFFVVYFIIISPRIPDWKKDIGTILVMVISAATFRMYYLLVAGFYVVIRVSSTVLFARSEKVSKKRIVILLLSMGVVYYCVLLVARRVSTSSYELLLFSRSMERGEGGEIATRIVPWFPSSNIYYYPLIYLTTVFRLLIPIELLPKGGKYLFYLFYQLILTYVVLRELQNIKQNPSYKNLALYFYLAFLLASAASELDFGTWVRHEAALFPIYLIIEGVIKMRKPKSVKGEVELI